MSEYYPGVNPDDLDLHLSPQTPSKVSWLTSASPNDPPPIQSVQASPNTVHPGIRVLAAASSMSRPDTPAYQPSFTVRYSRNINNPLAKTARRAAMQTPSSARA